MILHLLPFLQNRFAFILKTYLNHIYGDPCRAQSTVNNRHCAQGRKNREVEFSGGGRDCGD